ncbi:hypothetical protein HN011_002292 [Eciton burchellii]|nr:hypothetical protein HN011_002292 [Eciton burchellii]
MFPQNRAILEADTNTLPKFDIGDARKQEEEKKRTARTDSFEVLIITVIIAFVSAAVWDPENGSQLFAYKNAGALEYRTLQLFSDSYLLGASVAKSRIHIWPLNSPVPLNNIRLNTPGKVHALTCTPNGSYLIAAIEEKLIVWQTCNGRILANLSLCFGHGGACTRLYTISLDGKANIYEVSSGDLLLSLIYNVPLTAIAVNICDSELFVGCINGNILQCNLHNPPRGIEQHVNTDEENMVFKAHKSNVTALSVSVNCRILVSGSTDKAVHVWDIASKQVLRTMEHKGPVTAAFFAMSLQNEEIADKDTVIRVISRGRNLEELIDFKSYVDSNSDPDEQEDVKELENIQEELEKLKSINAKLYQYSVMHILDKIKNNGE